VGLARSVSVPASRTLATQSSLSMVSQRRGRRRLFLRARVAVAHSALRGVSSALRRVESGRVRTLASLTCPNSFSEQPKTDTNGNRPADRRDRKWYQIPSHLPPP